jgi:putative transposase
MPKNCANTDKLGHGILRDDHPSHDSSQASDPHEYGKLYNWKEKHQALQQGIALEESERDELKRLRREKQRITHGERNSKKGKCLLCERNEVKFRFIKQQSNLFPIALLCRVMSVSKSGYYDWHKRPANVINLETLKLYRLVRQLFKQSRGSLGNREMVKKLRKEGCEDSQ